MAPAPGYSADDLPLLRLGQLGEPLAFLLVDALGCRAFAGEIDHRAASAEDLEGLAGLEHVDLALQAGVCGLAPEHDDGPVRTALEDGDDARPLRGDVVVIELLAGTATRRCRRAGASRGTGLTGSARRDPREVHVARDLARGVNHRGLLVDDLQHARLDQVAVVLVAEVVGLGRPTILDTLDQVALEEVVGAAGRADFPIMAVDVGRQDLVATGGEHDVVLNVLTDVMPLEKHRPLRGRHFDLAQNPVVVHALALAVAASTRHRGNRGGRAARVRRGGGGLGAHRSRAGRGRIALAVLERVVVRALRDRGCAPHGRHTWRGGVALAVVERIVLRTLGHGGRACLGGLSRRAGRGTGARTRAGCRARTGAGHGRGITPARLHRSDDPTAAEDQSDDSRDCDHRRDDPANDLAHDGT